jgi:FG-GAP-like repeat
MRKGIRSRASCLRLYGTAAGALALYLLGGISEAVEAPVVPAASTGGFTVTYQRCSGCFMDWLEERVGDTGAWNAIGSGNKTYTSKAYGRYYYRVAYLYMSPNYSYYVDYSNPASVVVASAVPAVNPLEVQLTYRYEARRGDINGDGRTDLYVARASGGAAGDGTVDQVILRQAANGTFTASAPTGAEAQTARNWAIATVRILLKDVNVDGFADIVLDRIAAAIGSSSALNQIVYAPGELLRSAPRGIRPVDSAFKKFVTDAGRYVREPTYFADNAPLLVLVQTYYQYICTPGASGIDYPIYGAMPNCYPVPVTVVAVYPDYSSFSPNAVDLWNHESSIANGQIGMDPGLTKVQGLLESMAGVGVGGWTTREVIDHQHPIKSAAYRRGLELFTAILRMTEIGEGEPRESGPGERTGDAVYIVGRRIIGFLPMHTALEYRGSTISAYDSIDGLFDDGTLVSEVNWSRDRPLLMMTLGTVTGSLAAPLYWTQLIATDGRYPDNLPYDAVPSLGRAGYNSNGYAHGIVQATGGSPSISMSRFVGGEKPVPSSAFR